MNTDHLILRNYLCWMQYWHDGCFKIKVPYLLEINIDTFTGEILYLTFAFKCSRKRKGLGAADSYL
jgi:hypothetical protein